MKRQLTAIIITTFLLTVLATLAGCSGSEKYIKYVKNWKPYTNYGIKANVKTVLEKYLSNCEWTQVAHANGVTYYVNAKGQLEGTPATMRFYVNVSSKDISWGVQSFILEDETFEKEAAESCLEEFFDAYEAGAATISEYWSNLP